MQHKSVQRRKSEGTSLRLPRAEQGVADSAVGESSLGLAPTSISGKTFSRNNKAGVETSVDQLKVNESRTRRISEPGISTSSKLSASALAERLAQTVRSFSRSSHSPGQFSPTMTSNSTCSTPVSHGGMSPQPSADNINRFELICRTSLDKDCESWDDFLYHYRRGQFPADYPIPRPKLETSLLPSPPYVGPPYEYLPFLAPPLPPTEEQRLRALHSFQILQTGADPNFERITQLVAAVMNATGCVITLVDHRCVSVKAQHVTTFPEVPRQHSFCGHTILRPSNDPLVILDTKADWRFRALPAVVLEPSVRFYAGAPLTTSDGLNVGALCLIDFEPRATFSNREKELLVDFAAVVMREMELWNDQVQLCIRNRMMRDVTRWVRGCLDMGKDPPINREVASQDYRQGQPLAFRPVPQALLTPSDLSTSSSGILGSSAAGLGMQDEPALMSPPAEPAFPTPSGSPTFLSSTFASASKDGASSASSTASATPADTTGNSLQDKAFPSACMLIQATLNVDAVYLVQASSSECIIPPSGSSVVWNYLDAAGRRKNLVGVVKGAHVETEQANTSLTCVASSRKDRAFARPVFDEENQYAKRQESAWVCTDVGCRPHRLGDALLNAIEPIWRRDLPVIKEMLGYVREEIPEPPRVPGQGDLYTYSHDQDAIENDRFGSFANHSTFKDPTRRKNLCHTFQGTLPALASGAATPYQSAVVVPILGPSTTHNMSMEEPWAYFVILSASRTKQFSFHERIYLKNFGSCLVTEVMKRRVEAADKAKGIFIKSISHELRTPLHIILGVLELLYANPEEPLSDLQMAMVSSAEASGKNLIDTISNIIDLAKLDPDNNMEARDTRRDSTSILSPDMRETILETVDIRDLCQKVADSMAKLCTDKNVMVVPSWSKPSLSSLSSSTSNSTAGSATNVATSLNHPLQGIAYTSSTESLGSSFTARRIRSPCKTILELMVAMDEPERDPGQGTYWNFSMDVKSITRILTQLVENAIKFTTAGFVEISAVALTDSPVPMKPPHPEARPIVFTVRDTGKGISAEFVQSHLFKPFSQEDPLQVGTGLGMALVKGVVEKLGGWMEVWSEGEGKGCVVRVLVWATPAPHQTKSLRDIIGPWHGASCRFYAGEHSVSSDRLFKVMGERMMGQQLNMNVERGDEQDITGEDMLRDLYDQSRCGLLIINDDVTRLRTYLSFWTEYYQTIKEGEIETPKTPMPLLVLTSPPNTKVIQKLVDAYLEKQIDSERPAGIVIMTKPIGPVKLIQCLRECFTPAFSNLSQQSSSQELPHSSSDVASMSLHPIPLTRSATIPQIARTTLGIHHDSRLFSASTAIEKSLALPTIAQADGNERRTMAVLPPHSPGGLVLPPRTQKSRPSSVKTPDQESRPRNSTTNSEDRLGTMNVQSTTPPAQGSVSNGTVSMEGSKYNIEESAPKHRLQRSMKDYQAQKKLQRNKSALAAGTTGTTTGHPAKDIKSSGETPRKPWPRVLIVEDNITNRMILRTFLKKRGISVVEAENGKVGVERFQEEVWRREGRAGFDFVLMDLQMPVMDGNIATKRIREFERSMTKQFELSHPLETESCADEVDANMEQGRGYHPTIIFALTGLAGDEDKRLAFECGVDGYMTKPVSLKILGALMSSCMPTDMEGLTLINPACQIPHA
ncbi:hypothetical protein BC939DRAFT_319071 [Gamsiella multidivaricata]|uniref:uncharacterized protein n=1 Tax=Gamsiella multidivaricata TaxID=101098 RepID=UPI00221F77E5|nr:uncharacterized protein BC939DRAFT_319071 [Gamsiella multidivaricata]KAI7817620.1 hypothetical protein BC939DRAFT_319071 [Gamsiella multidivaricata]